MKNKIELKNKKIKNKRNDWRNPWRFQLETEDKHIFHNQPRATEGFKPRHAWTTLQLRELWDGKMDANIFKLMTFSRWSMDAEESQM